MSHHKCPGQAQVEVINHMEFPTRLQTFNELLCQLTQKVWVVILYNEKKYGLYVEILISHSGPIAWCPRVFGSQNIGI